MRTSTRAAAFAAVLVAATATSLGALSGPALAAGATPVAMTVTAKATIPAAGTASVTGALGVTLTQPEQVTVVRSDRKSQITLPTVPVATDGTFAFQDTPAAAGTVTYMITYAGDDTYAAGETEAILYERVVPFDFNGDGYADAVVGSEGEAIGSIKNAGTVYDFHGSASGVSTSGSKLYQQGGSGLAGTAETNDTFGASQASGDFNGDGYADLAVSAPGETIDGHKAAGDVTILWGSASGLSTSGSVVEYGSKTAGAQFGIGIAAGDFNDDGSDELAVGSPGTDQVFEYYGMTPGHAGSATTFTQGSGGIPGAKPDGDGRTLFGWNLSVGDVNGDGMDDLAVGAPYDWQDTGFSSGSVVVLLGSAERLNTSGVEYVDLNTAGVVGAPGAFTSSSQPDSFGWQARLADVNGDGRSDLVVGAPGRPVSNSTGKHEDAGEVFVLYSKNGAITGSGSAYYTQDSAGIAGAPGKGDQWGSTLVAGDVNHDGFADIVATGTDRYVDYIPGSASGPVTASAKDFTQSTAGIIGTDTAGDYWGDSLEIVPIKGAGAPAALMVGAPGKHGGEGSVSILYANSTGPTGTGSVYIDQNSAGVSGTAEKGDAMGTFFQ